MKRLEGKCAIVTGGASGIGQAIVDLFSKEGARVISVDKNDTVLKQTDEHRKIHAMVYDVSKEASWIDLVARVQELYGNIDILINNAGISSEKQYYDISIDDWEDMMVNNSFSQFAGIKHVTKAMRDMEKGAIVNIASYTALIGQGFNHYTASKGAVRAMSKAAATAFAGEYVRVNTIFPGVINTPMVAGLSESKGALDALIGGTPLGRLGEPEDIASAALFLASDESDYITGAELVVDGGFSAQ